MVACRATFIGSARYDRRVRLPVRCVDLTAAHVVLAMRSRDHMQKLLLHMAAIARPAEGAAKIFVPIARIASDECTWMEKVGLRVEIRDGRKKGTTEIMVAADLDGELRELLFPRLHLAVDRGELVRALAAVPGVIAPLTATFTPDLLLLTCAEEIVGTIAPPAYEDTEEEFRQSLSAELRMSLAPVATVANPIVPPAPRRPTLTELDDIDDGWQSTVAPNPALPPAPAPKKERAPTITAKREIYRTPLATDAPRPELRRRKG